MPGWPGPLLIVAGALLAVGAFVAASLIADGQLTIANPSSLLWLGGIGIALLVAGIAYVAVHQIRVRRHLAPERYRGPNILALVALVFIIGSAISVPFADDVGAMLEGRAPSLLGSLVILAGTQVAMLLVAWLFVFRPNALAGLPHWAGRDPARAVLTGLGVGIAAWVGGSIVAALIATVLESLGFDVTPQAAEEAINTIEPWLVVIPIVVLAPIAEEIFFRGIVFNALLREAGPRWAFLGSATLFAIVHASVVAFVPILLLGLVLAWIYRRTQSLLAAIVVHATFNGLSVLLALLQRYDVINLPT